MRDVVIAVLLVAVGFALGNVFAIARAWWKAEREMQARCREHEHDQALALTEEQP